MNIDEFLERHRKDYRDGPHNLDSVLLLEHFDQYPYGSKKGEEIFLGNGHSPLNDSGPILHRTFFDKLREQFKNDGDVTFRKVKQYASSREYKDFAKSIEKQGRLSRREADKQIRKWKREQQEKENRQRRVEEQKQRTEEFHGTYTQFQAGDREFTVNTIRRFNRGADEWLNPTVNIYDSKNNENLFVEVESEEKGLETVRDIEKSFENKSDVSLFDVKRHLDEQGLKTNMERQEQQQQTQQPANGQDIALARKAGYVQGVCECALVVSGDRMLTKKLLSEMGVTRDMAQKFAKPETFKEMEQSVYAQKNERSLEHKNHIKL